jgi:hypothetical protein
MAMPQARNLFREHISKALHAQYDETSGHCSWISAVGKIAAGLHGGGAAVSAALIIDGER